MGVRPLARFSSKLPASALLALLVLASIGRSGVVTAQAPELPPFRGLIDHISATTWGGVPYGSVDLAPHAMSGDGRYVVFTSNESTLVDGDFNWMPDVFLRDRTTGTTTRLSVGWEGGDPNGMSDWATVSTDGRHVAFGSGATNLVEGDTNGAWDVFVRDRAAGRTVRVSIATDGTQADRDSGLPAISATGRFVAFVSAASNLAPEAGGGMPMQAYVHDRDVDGNGIFDEPGGGETSLVSISIAGGPADGYIDRLRVSADGRFVLFETQAGNLHALGNPTGVHHLYVRDRQLGTTSVIDAAADGRPSAAGIELRTSDMSDDGRFVTFASYADDIVPLQPNGRSQLFRIDRAAGPAATAVVTARPDGTVADGWSYSTAVSGDGRYVAFVSTASNLVSPAAAPGPGLLVVRDMVDGRFIRADVLPTGVPFDHVYPYSPSISADGTAVAFTSDSVNAVNGWSSSGAQHAFVATAFTVDPLSASFPETGGTGTVYVNTTAVTGWNAASPDPWIALTAGAGHGAGPRAVQYVVSPNDTGIVRNGRIVVGSTTIAIRQDGDGDNTPPVVTPTVTGTLSAGGWYTTDVTIQWSISDPESEIVSTNGCATWTFTTDFLYAAPFCEATSHGGTSAVTVPLKRDTTGPAINLAVPQGAVYRVGAVVLPSYQCSDPYAGVASCLLTEGSSPLDTTAPGRHRITVTAVDHVGNRSSRQVEYVVVTDQCVALEDAPRHLTGWWRFDGSFRDEVSARDGVTNLGSPRFATAIAGQGWDNHAFGDLLWAWPGSEKLAGAGLTIATWVLPRGVFGEYGTIVDNPLQYRLARFSDGTLRWAFADGTGFAWVNTGIQLPAHVWSHVAVTYRDGAVHTYLNGRLAHSGQVGAALIVSGNPALNMTIGGRQGTAPASLNGLVDDLMIFDEALSAAAVDSLVVSGGGSLCGPFQTDLTLTVPETVVYGSTFTVSAVLNDSAGRPMRNRDVTLTSAITPGYVWQTTTDAAGSTVVSFPINSEIVVGEYPEAIEARFAGDAIYEAAAARKGVVVVGGNVPVSWTQPSPIVYGTPLGPEQLNATSSFPGSFTYSPAAGTVLTAGTHTLTGTFTPTDTSHWAPKTVTTTLVVTKAVPSVEISSAPVFYTGAPRQATVQVRGSGGVELNPVTVLYNGSTATPTSAGSYALEVRFAGDANHEAVSVSGTFVIAKATPIVPTINDIVGTYDGQPWGVAVHIAGVAGEWLTPVVTTYNGSTDTPVNAGIYAGEVRYDGSANYNAVTRSFTVTILKANPRLTWTAPEQIVYGTALDGRQLNATSNISGTFSYSPAAGTVLGAGTHTLSATFTPADPTNFQSGSVTARLTVTKAQPSIAWNAPTAVTYGTPLGAAQLNATPSAPGTLTYTPAAGTVLNAGQHILSVTFVPEDPANFTNTSRSVPFTVTKAAPVVSWSAPAEVIYGTALGAAQLSAAANVPGTFAYWPAAGTIPSAGAQTLSVTFTADDAMNYTQATASVTLTVRKATATLTWDSPAPVVYGTPLGAAQLNATADIPGTFTYVPGAGAVLGAGTHTLTAMFVPADSTNFQGGSVTTILSVTRAQPSIAWNAPSPVVYGTPLGAAQLNATADIPGTFTYVPGAGVVLGAGTHTLTAAFVPADVMNHEAGSVSTTLTIAKAESSIAWSVPAAVAYGTPLSAAQLNATSSVPGTLTYSPAPGTILDAGQHTLTATFVPDDAANFMSTSITVPLTVTKAVPVMSWSAPADVTYGTVLGAEQLDASANVPGTFAYSPGAGTILPAGAQTLSVTFTPDDATNYTQAAATVTLAVRQAAAAVTWVSPAPIVYGTALGPVQLNATADVPGTFTYAPAAGTVLGAGTHTLTATFTPADSANHTGSSATAALIVTRAPLLIVAADASKPFGAPLPAFSATGSGFVAGDSMASLAGVPSFATTATASSAVGSYAVTPAGVASPNYAITFASGTLNVVRASTVTAVAATPNPAGLNGPVTLSAMVTAVAPGAGGPTGHIQFFDGATLVGSAPLLNGVASLTTAGLASGAHGISASYSGDGSFQASSGTTSLTIQPAAGSSTTVVTASANPASVGQSVTLTATVSGPAGITGDVAFYDGSDLLGTVPLSGTTAQLTTAGLAAGGHAIVARYLGNAIVPPSTSSVLAQFVQPSGAKTRTTTTALTASPSPAALGSAVALTATVTGAQNKAPTGVVMLMVNGVAVAQSPVAAQSSVTARATFSTSALPHGTHRIEAVYLGDGTFRASVGTVSLPIQ